MGQSAQPMRKSSKAFFTPAAREAARLARQARLALRAQAGEHDVFVTRSTVLPMRYHWEIRKFGGVVVKTSLDVFASAAAARRAGEGLLQQFE